MRNTYQLIFATVINWAIFFGCLAVLLTIPLVGLGGFIPAELAEETLYAPYRQLEIVLILIIVASALAGMFNTVFLFKNLRANRSAQSEKAKVRSIDETESADRMEEAQNKRLGL